MEVGAELLHVKEEALGGGVRWVQGQEGMVLSG